MSDEKKQLQKQAMERLQKGTWSMQPEDLEDLRIRERETGTRRCR
jgi:hypothetical protein